MRTPRDEHQSGSSNDGRRRPSRTVVQTSSRLIRPSSPSDRTPVLPGMDARSTVSRASWLASRKPSTPRAKQRRVRTPAGRERRPNGGRERIPFEIPGDRRDADALQAREIHIAEIRRRRGVDGQFAGEVEVERGLEREEVLGVDQRDDGVDVVPPPGRELEPRSRYGPDLPCAGIALGDEQRIADYVGHLVDAVEGAEGDGLDAADCVFEPGARARRPACRRVEQHDSLDLVGDQGIGDGSSLVFHRQRELNHVRRGRAHRCRGG